MTDYLRSKTIRTILALAGGVLLLLLAFVAGVSVGESKGRHFYGLSSGFERAFQRGPGFRGAFPPPPLPGGYGVFGKVLSVSGTTMVVHGREDVDQTVLMTSSTIIRAGRNDGTLADIQPDKNVGVFGMPNGEGQIVARLIRLVD